MVTGKIAVVAAFAGMFTVVDAVTVVVSGFVGTHRVAGMGTRMVDVTGGCSELLN